MSRLHATKDDITQLFVSYERTREERVRVRDVEARPGGDANKGERDEGVRPAFPQDVDALKVQLKDAHGSAKHRITASRAVGRKEKKRRKRRIAQGITSAIFGTGAIVADTKLPVLFAFSYGLGGSALHQALRDIVGEPPD
jgi:hypothetical protein